MSLKLYKPQDFSKVRGLAGISNDQVEEHLKLYEGYVKRTNALTEKLEGLAKEGKASGADPVYAELTRRLGFEYDGIINHEYYFGNLTAGAQAEPPAGLEAGQGHRGLLRQPLHLAGRLPGHRHHAGHRLGHDLPGPVHRLALQPLRHAARERGPGRLPPILVLDGWEHAFMRDYKAFERGKYVEAFFKNVDWAAVEARLK